jgi:outer membrane protein assembly factor BamB
LRYLRAASLVAVLVLSLAAVAAPASDTATQVFTGTGGSIKSGAGDWPQWRGPNRDGHSPETGMLRQWPQDGPPLLWKIDTLGRGISGLSIVGNRFYTMGDRDGKCHALCYDLDTQKEVWHTPIDEAITDGPRCTPTVDGDRVYVMAATSQMACLDAATGKILWKKHMKRDFGGHVQGSYDYCESPLVDGDNVIVTPGGAEATIVALNKKTGDVVWKAACPGYSDWGVGYSSLVVSEACGVRQYVTLLGHGLVSVDAKTGKFLWGYHRIANSHTSIPTPIVRGDYVFSVNGYGAGSCVVKIVKDGDGLKAQEVWFLNSDKFQSTCGQAVIVGDYIYSGHGDRDGQPICVDFMTGNILWKQGENPPGHGVAHVIAVDGMIVYRYITHEVALVEANSKAFTLLGVFKIDPGKGAGLAPTALSNGRLFIRVNEMLYCYDIKKH